MNGKMKSCVKGLLMGICGKPLPLAMAQKEPIAYSYNGVVLPKLPELAKKEYPYAVIAIGNLEGYVLFLSKNPIKYMTTDGYVWGGERDDLVIDGDFEKYDRLTHEGELEELDYWQPALFPDSLAIYQGTYDTDKDVYIPGFMWANHEVLEGDIVRIAPSEPVPVYE